MFGSGLQMPELLIILLLVVLLFGARKLPDTARGLGRALRIFKSETKGLNEEDRAAGASSASPAPAQAPKQIPPATSTEPPQPSTTSAPERERDER